MPITAQQLTDKLASALDAEGNDFYRFDRDYMFAINYGVGWLTNAINRKLGSNKFSEEALRELTKVYVYQTNTFSRVNIPDTIWSVVAVYPKPNVYPSSATLIATIDNAESKLRDDLSYVSSLYAATRLTAEEWNLNQGNPFAPGFDKEPRASVISYAYRGLVDYSSSGYVLVNPREIEVRPATASDFIALEMIKNPTPVALITDTLQFPVSMTELITNLALVYIARKQGDETNIYGIAEKDLLTEIQMF